MSRMTSTPRTTNTDITLSAYRRQTQLTTIVLDGRVCGQLFRVGHYGVPSLSEEVKRRLSSGRPCTGVRDGYGF